MDNPFDQFDAPAATKNPFDQFDGGAPAPKAAKPAPIDPNAIISGVQSIGHMLRNTLVPDATPDDSLTTRIGRVAESLNPYSLMKQAGQGALAGSGELLDAASNFARAHADQLGPLGPLSADAIQGNVTPAMQTLGGADDPYAPLPSRVARFGGKAAPMLAGALAAPELDIPAIGEALPTIAKIPGVAPTIERTLANLLRAGTLTGEQSLQEPNQSVGDAAKNFGINALTFGVPGAVPFANPIARAASGAAIGAGINEGASRLQGQAPSLESDIFGSLQGLVGGFGHVQHSNAPDVAQEQMPVRMPEPIAATPEPPTAPAEAPSAPSPPAGTGSAGAVPPLDSIVQAFRETHPDLSSEIGNVLESLTGKPVGEMFHAPENAAPAPADTGNPARAVPAEQPVQPHQLAIREVLLHAYKVAPDADKPALANQIVQHDLAQQEAPHGTEAGSAEPRPVEPVGVLRGAAPEPADGSRPAGQQEPALGRDIAPPSADVAGERPSEVAPENRTPAPASVVAPTSPKMYVRGKSGQVVQLADGTWRVRNREVMRTTAAGKPKTFGNWQPWEARDTFDPSHMYGYKQHVPDAGRIRIPGVGMVELGERTVRAKAEPDTGLLSHIAGAGGLNRESFHFPAKDYQNEQHGVGRWLYASGKDRMGNDKGMTEDKLLEFLQENNYLPHTPFEQENPYDVNTARDLLDRAMSGHKVYRLGEEPMPEEPYYGEEPEQDVADFHDNAHDHFGFEIPAGDEAMAMAVSHRAAESAGMSPDEYRAHVEDLVQEEKQHDADRQAATQDRHGVVPEGASREAPAETPRAGGFSLTSQESPKPHQALAPAEEQSTLFAPPTAQDHVGDLQRARDARRDGKTGRIASSPHTGDGGIFDPLYGEDPGQTRFSRGESSGKRDFVRDSKVKGVVYHATSNSFDAFDTSKSDLGAHFGTLDQANKIARDRIAGRPGESGPNIMPVHLRITNPLRLKDEGSFHAWSIADQLALKGIISKEQAGRFKSDGWRANTQNNAAARDAIRNAGYDSVVYKNTQEGRGDSYIALDPSQVKSATGNRGTFDPNSPDIRYSSGESAPGLPRQDVHETARRVLGMEPDKAGVHVVSTTDELPQAVRDDMRSQGIADGEVRGAYHGGKSYLVASNLRSAEEAEAAIFHEHYTHGGLRAKYGNALGDKLDTLLQGVGGVDGVRRLADKQGIDLSQYEDSVLGNEAIRPQDQKRILMEELMAHMSSLTGTLKRTVQEYVGALRDFLRRRGFAALADMGETDLAHVLKQAREAVQEKASGNAPRSMFQRVFHGTPHRGIEQEGFKLHKIGTGEGAQSYGWGLYFAKAKEIAEHYRENLSAKYRPGNKIKWGGKTASQHYEAADNRSEYGKMTVLERIMLHQPKSVIEAYLREGVDEGDAQAIDGMAYLNSLPKQAFAETAGQLYHAEVPEDSDLLDYDKPIAQQPPKVRAVLARLGFEEKPVPVIKDPTISRVVTSAKRDAGESHDIAMAIDNDRPLQDAARQHAFAHGMTKETLDDMGGAGAYVEGLAKDYLEAQKNNRELTGEAIYHALSADGGSHPILRGSLAPGARGPRGASELLNEAGIPGLRYLDGSSRGKGDGSHNYVIWNEDHIGDVTPYYSRSAQESAPDDRRAQAMDMLRSARDGSPNLHEHLSRLTGRTFTPEEAEQQRPFLTALAKHPKTVEAMRAAEAAKPTTGVRNEKVDAAREARGADELKSSAPQSTADREQAAHETLSADQNAGTRLVDKILTRGHVPNQAETDLLNLHLANVDAAHTAAVEHANSLPADANMDDKATAMAHMDAAHEALDRAEQASDVSGTALSRSFSARKAEVTKEGVFKRWGGYIKAKGGGKPLSETKSAAIRSLTDELHAAQQKIRELSANRVARKAGVRKDTDAKVQALLDKLKAMPRQAEQEKASAMFARAPSSKVETPASIVRQIASEFVRGGETDAQALVDRVHGLVADRFGHDQVRDIISGVVRDHVTPTKSEYRVRMDEIRKELRNTDNAAQKTRLQAKLEDLRQQRDSGQIRQPVKREKLPEDDATLQLKKQVSQVQRKLERIASEQEKANQSGVAKVMDFGNKYHRFAILTHLSALTKLPAAVLWKIASEHAEEGVGTGTRALAHVLDRFGASGFKELHDKSLRYGQGLGFADLKGIAGIRYALKEGASQILRGQDELDTEFGNKYLTEQEWANSAGRVHSLLKEPAKMHAFELSLAKRYQSEYQQALQKTGSEAKAEAYVNDPARAYLRKAAAYKDAMEAIMQGDNALVDTVRQVIRQHGGVGSQKLFDFLFPIVKVPANMLTEYLSYKAGWVKAITRVFKKGGIKGLSPEDADYVMKNIKKQGVSLALHVLGALASGSLGGVKVGDDSKSKGRDIPFLSAQIGEGDGFWNKWGKNWFHSAPANVFQDGAEYARLWHKGNPDGGMMDMLRSIMDSSAATTGASIMENAPILSSVNKDQEFTEPGRRLESFLGSQLRSFIPGAVQDVASGNVPFGPIAGSDTDTHTYRHPQDIGQDMKVGIPGLRDDVPTKSPHHSRK